MTTREMKAKAEGMGEFYDEYLEQCKKDKIEPMEFWSWFSMEIATAEEEMNEYRRNEGITDEQ